MRPTCWIQAALVGFAAGALFGCATRDSGYKISDETIAFVHPGVTTRAEVIENLGQPLLELQEPRVAAYSWGKMRAVAGKPAVREESPEGRHMGYGMVMPPPSQETGLIESRRWIFCIAMDGQDRVTRIERIKLEGANSLEEAVRNWASSAR